MFSYLRHLFGIGGTSATQDSTSTEHVDLPKDIKITPPTLAEELKTLNQDQAKLLVTRKAHITVVPPSLNKSQPEQHDRPDSDGTPIESRRLFLDFTEHFHVADDLPLPGITTENQTSKDRPLLLQNGLKLTYGQINALAGDFFSTATPISSQNGFQLQQLQFVKAYETLAASDPAKPIALLDVLRVEVEKVDQAIRHGLDVRKVYAELGDRLAKLEFASERGTQKPGEDYISLLKKNRDHFYPDHRTAYNAGHAKAIEIASSGKIEDLARAYAMNAFADHYLQDAFASGHLRVPRVKMMNTNIFTNILANFMHNEDNINGLNVQTPGEHPYKWKCYGDSMMFTDEGTATYQQLRHAVSASIGEIWAAHNNPVRTTTDLKLDPKNFTAWSFCVDESLIMSQRLGNHCPMFIVHEETGDIWQRKGLDQNGPLSPSSPLKTFSSSSSGQQQQQQKPWEFEPVYGESSLGYSILKHLPKETLEYIYFGILAFRCSPVGELRHTVLQRIELCLLNAGLNQHVVDRIMKILGIF